MMRNAMIVLLLLVTPAAAQQVKIAPSASEIKINPRAADTQGSTKLTMPATMPPGTCYLPPVTFQTAEGKPVVLLSVAFPFGCDRPAKAENFPTKIDPKAK